MNDIALWAIAIAVAGHAVTWLFRTPKEVSTAIERRIGSLEVDVRSLTRTVDTLSADSKALAKDVDQLTGRIEKLINTLLEKGNGRARGA